MSVSKFQRLQSFIKSRTHRIEPLQLFPTQLVVKDMVKHLEVKSGCSILAQGEIKAQTDYQKTLEEPYPRMHLELQLYWDSETRTVAMFVRIANLENNSACARYVLQTFLSKEGSMDKAQWASGIYFGEPSKIKSMIGMPLLLWTWNFDMTTKNLSNDNHSPIGNLESFLDNGALTIHVELFAMSTLKVVTRLLNDEFTYKIRNQFMYTELVGNRFRSSLEMLYKEFGNYDLTLFSVDRKSYFLCHKKKLMEHSTVFAEIFQTDDASLGAHIFFMLNNVTTLALRIILLYIYKKQIHPIWKKHIFEVFCAFENLKVNAIKEKFMDKLKRYYKVDEAFIVEVWTYVHQYRVAVDKSLRSHRMQLHAKLHPGVECGAGCRGR